MDKFYEVILKTGLREEYVAIVEASDMESAMEISGLLYPGLIVKSVAGLGVERMTREERLREDGRIYARNMPKTTNYYRPSSPVVEISKSSPFFRSIGMRI